MFSIYEFEQQLQAANFQPNRITHGQENLLTQPSEYLPVYTSWFQDVVGAASEAMEYIPARLTENRISQAVWEPNSPYSSSYKKPRIVVEECTRRGAVVTYNVVVGSFVVHVRMLNVN